MGDARYFGVVETKHWAIVEQKMTFVLSSRRLRNQHMHIWLQVLPLGGVFCSAPSVVKWKRVKKIYVLQDLPTLYQQGSLDAVFRCQSELCLQRFRDVVSKDIVFGGLSNLY